MSDTVIDAEDAAEPQTAPARPDTAGAAETPSAAFALNAETRGILRALAGEQRQDLLALFAGGAELTVSSVAERMGIAQPTASQRLAALRRSGVLSYRKDGRQVYYRIDARAVERSLTELLAYLRTGRSPEAGPT
ncbi:ArsR/SmtB family transcription factor [Actinomadura atramentaria]|uniref:ArsR/SmtB family transcription factor n=1 Tax=Actinomadura atramentaria TaxID=1990 RepID=UPI00036F4EE8|nr:metalloregulator ArsR/SmtB family transcription factor [Actinomadura atramentaria]